YCFFTSRLQVGVRASAAFVYCVVVYRPCLSFFCFSLCVDGFLVCAEGYTQVTGVMAMMMTGRVLLVCALCVLWCGGAGGVFCEEASQDDSCDNLSAEVLSLRENKSDEELKEKCCKKKDEETTCLNTLRNNSTGAINNGKTKENDASHRDPNVAHGAGMSVGSQPTTSSTAAGANTAGKSPPLPASTLNASGGVDTQIHSPLGGASHQPHFDDDSSQEERRNHPEVERCSEGQADSDRCSHVSTDNAAAEESHQHNVGMQGKTILKKDEKTSQTGLKSAEASEGTDGATAPPKDPPNTDESLEDESQRVAPPATSLTQNTSSASSQDKTSQSSSPSGSGIIGSSDNNDREKTIHTKMSGAPLKDEGEHRENTSGNEDATTVEPAAVQSNTTTADGDSSTTFSHTTSPLLLLLVVACAAAAAAVAA
ncbi:mucin-associated surface protein (MASP), putative, partial [Trypanosoma cruzi marinkellei]